MSPWVEISFTPRSWRIGVVLDSRGSIPGISPQGSSRLTGCCSRRPIGYVVTTPRTRISLWRRRYDTSNVLFSWADVSRVAALSWSWTRSPMASRAGGRTRAKGRRRLCDVAGADRRGGRAGASLPRAGTYRRCSPRGSPASQARPRTKDFTWPDSLELRAFVDGHPGSLREERWRRCHSSGALGVRGKAIERPLDGAGQPRDGPRTARGAAPDARTARMDEGQDVVRVRAASDRRHPLRAPGPNRVTPASHSQVKELERWSRGVRGSPELSADRGPDSGPLKAKLGRIIRSAPSVEPRAPVARGKGCHAALDPVPSGHPRAVVPERVDTIVYVRERPRQCRCPDCGEGTRHGVLGVVGSNTLKYRCPAAL